MKKQKKISEYTNKEAITIILFYLVVYLLELFAFASIFINAIETKF